MSDTHNFMALYQNHQKTVAEANVLNKITVFDALLAAGIATVTVTFDGEGDSGQIENIMADGSETIPPASIELQQTAWGTGKLEIIRTTLRAAIEALCYDYLEQEHGGWENNDGAFGEFTFNVAERRIELDFSSRYTDTAHFSHTF